MQIIGHKKQLSILENAMKKRAVSQAYLFLGPENVGKFTIALDFGKKLTGSGKDLNPNLYIVKPEINEENSKQKEIKIEAIKDLQHWLSLSSYAENMKVAIIDEAQKLNKTAQNALLKTLEEARLNTVTILVSQDEKKILPTILSRCHKIKFGTVSNGELQESSEEEIGKDVLFWSIGKPGIFKKLLESGTEMEFRQEVFREFKNIFSQNVLERMVLAETMSGDIEMTIKKLNLWLVIIRESIVSANFNEDFTVKKIELLEKIEKSLNLINQTNANAKMVLENLLISF